jgi:trans-aconitate 2-methyltransferase
MPWDPVQYLAFESERSRPALDLLARVPHEAPARVVDLGCGAGNVTRLLRARWPGAHILGVDQSAEMLAAAARAADGVSWRQADLATWMPDAPVDVIFSNAALHWVDDHATLLPRLLGCLAPGGWLAVQMPRNHDRPSHTAAFDLIDAQPAWARRLALVLRRSPVQPAEAYLALLAAKAGRSEAWETDYLHRLEGEDPVLAWTRGTFLAPLLEGLDEADRGVFLEAYRRKVREAYPPDAGGGTTFRFRRLFLVARR